MKKALAAIGLLALVVIAVFSWRTHLTNELRKPLLARLADPDTAIFRNERLLFGWSEWSVKGNILCGEVNAKNKMGGYSGYVKFSAAAGINANLGDNDLELGLIDSTCK